MKKSGIFFLLCFWIISCSDPGDHHLELPEPGVVEDKKHRDWCIEHNEWTYRQMSHHYFWYTEMPDSSTVDFSLEPPKFFEALKSRQDRFSWCEANTEYQKDTGSASIGFEYQPYRDKKGNLINQILYVESAQLKKEGLKRGMWVSISQNSPQEVTLQKGHIKDGIFVKEKDIRYMLSTIRNTSLNSTVSLDSVYSINGQKIGYVIYDNFEASTDVIQIAVKFKNKGIDNLILDLRYNPGGYVATAEYLASLIVPHQALGKIYQKQRYNDKITQEETSELNNGYRYVYFHTEASMASRNLNLPRVVILTTENTASASESTIIGLRPYMQVITIGTTTYGKDVGSYTIADNRYKYQLQPITFRYYNALNDSTPESGIPPTIRVDDDLSHERGDTREALLKTALEYLAGTGPAKSRPAGENTHNGYPLKQGLSSIQLKHPFR